PCSADCWCISLPSCDDGYSLTWILPPLFAATSSANLCAPMLIGWSVLFRWPNLIVRSWMSWAWTAVAPVARASARASRVRRVFIEMLLEWGREGGVDRTEVRFCAR